MRERRRALAGPLAGLGLLLLLLYLNFGDRLRFLIPAIPAWRWGSGGRRIVSGFVGVNGTHFVLKTEGGAAGWNASSSPSGIRLSSFPLYVNGWNSYWLMQQSIWVSTRPRVSRMLSRGAEMGMTVCRTWAFSDGGTDPLQISPRHFDERVFRKWPINEYGERCWWSRSSAEPSDEACGTKGRKLGCIIFLTGLLLSSR